MAPSWSRRAFRQDTAGSSMDEPLRIDKWLWTARLFKTRSLAARFCQAGKVKIRGRRVKPARPVAVGEELQITRTHHRQTVLVTGLKRRRVSAGAVAELYTDVTPEQELDKLQTVKMVGRAFRQSRPSAGGRPTKRERRAIQKLKGTD